MCLTAPSSACHIGVFYSDDIFANALLIIEFPSKVKVSLFGYCSKGEEGGGRHFYRTLTSD